MSSILTRTDTIEFQMDEDENGSLVVDDENGTGIDNALEIQNSTGDNSSDNFEEEIILADSPPQEGNQEKSALLQNMSNSFFSNDGFETDTIDPNARSPEEEVRNFILFSVLFSANHGGVVSCLSLATARLGNLGAWQSSALYLSYTLSAMLGASYFVKELGSKGAVEAGMWIYCVYIACFIVAVALPAVREVAAIFGALVGGIGGGFMWTAQGSYFTRAAEEYAAAKFVSIEEATSLFGGIFAAIYLSEEVLLRLFSSTMIRIWNWSWVSVFVGYTVIAIVSVAFMVKVVHTYPPTEKERLENASTSSFHKASAVFRLLVTDYKMKYMIPLCAVFGFAASFMTSFVNGEVISKALEDDQSIYVGVLTSITAAVAALFSIIFGFSAKKIGNGAILLIGCAAFFIPSLLFIIKSDLEEWTLPLLVVVYSLQGIGRATFEGTLRAEFATIFAREKEGAFGNIVFLNGLISTIGFMLSTRLNCKEESRYCIEYRDGSHHDVLVYEVMVMVSAVLAVFGYWRAKYLFKAEKETEARSSLLVDDHLL